jgi:hypothetical protein
MQSEITPVTVKKYKRNVPHQYKKRLSKPKKGLTRSRSIRIDEDVYLQLVLLKHGNMTISDVVSFLLLQPGTSNINEAVQPPAPTTLLDRILGK